MPEQHVCENIPDTVHVCDYDYDNGWCICLANSVRLGYDERVYSSQTVIIPIEYCPWCGKRLENEVKQ